MFSCPSNGIIIHINKYVIMIGNGVKINATKIILINDSSTIKYLDSPLHTPLTVDEFALYSFSILYSKFLLFSSLMVKSLFFQLFQV